MLQVIILVCAASLSPQDCQRDTATDVIIGPEAASIAACGMLGQTTLAGTGLRRHEGEYVKIRCEPDRRARTAQR